MAIISKPEIINKGTTVTFTMFKGNLINNSVVSSDEHFSNFDNWLKVNLTYQSTEGNQVKTVSFDSSDGFYQGFFTSSSKVRDAFMIQSITIIDLDGEILKIDREFLNSLEFDIEFSVGEEAVLLLDDGAMFLLDSGEYLTL